jgi:putative endonuclease
MVNHRTALGKQAETFVANYLTQHGYTVLATNFSCKAGEIDVIACKKRTLAFVEVKARKDPLFNISEVITPSKQQKIIKTARYYIFKQQQYTNYAFRFDVALLAYNTTSGAPETQLDAAVDTVIPEITYIEDAFTETQRDT